MIEYLKDLFGGGALTFEEFSGKLEKAEGVKLANLKEGGYVGRDKFDALAAERDGLKSQLAEASGKLEGYDPEWKAKAEGLRKEAEDKVKAVRFDYALKAALRDAGARNPAVVAGALRLDALQENDGKILGLKEQLDALRDSDPYLFESGTPAPSLVLPGSPQPRKTADQESMDAFYANNPFYHRK
nr:MAG TPA: minor structural protein [Caudoviricetes sp.]